MHYIFSTQGWEYRTSPPHPRWFLQLHSHLAVVVNVKPKSHLFPLSEVAALYMQRKAVLYLEHYSKLIDIGIRYKRNWFRISSMLVWNLFHLYLIPVQYTCHRTTNSPYIYSLLLCILIRYASGYLLDIIVWIIHSTFRQRIRCVPVLLKI